MERTVHQILHALANVISSMRSARAHVVDATSLKTTPWPADVPVLAPKMPTFDIDQLRSDCIPDLLACIEDARHELLAFTKVITADDDEIYITVADLSHDYSALMLVFSSDRPSLDHRPIETAPNSISFTVDASGTISHVAEIGTTALGDNADDLVGQSFADRVHPEDAAIAVSEFAAMAEHLGHPQLQRLRLRAISGWRWFEVFGVVAPGNADRSMRLTAVDVHAETEALNELRRNVDRFSLLADSLPFGVFLADLNGPIEVMNEEFRTMLGDAMVNRSDAQSRWASKNRLVSWWDFVDESHQARVIDAVTATGMFKPYDHELISGTDELGDRYCRIHVRPVSAQAGSPTQFIGVVADITDERRAKDELRRAAQTDPLTGLANRRALEERLRAHQRMADGESCAVLFIDVDGFDQINNTYGHEIGDRLIKTVAERVKSRVRAGDVVARFGGSSFVVWSMQHRGMSGGLSLAHDLKRVIVAPITIDNSSTRPKVAIGVAAVAGPTEAGGDDLICALADAGAAMYEAKSAGASGVRAATVGLRSRVARRLRLETDIGPAIAAGELTMVYQPICDLETGGLVAAESLVRWEHPQYGSISPVEILEVAEASESLADLTMCCVDAVARDLRQFREDFPLHQFVRFGLNGSPAQLRIAHYAETHVEVLHRHQLEPRDVVVEITESDPINADEDAAATVHELAEFGVEISLDDFGSGYSSLEYLTRLPITSLKIDRSIVKQIGRTESARKIIAGIRALCDSLDITVLAEGVETADEMDACRRAGITRVQGFVIAKPGPPSQLAHLPPRTAPPAQTHLGE